jgi:hypothetical protein
MQKKQAEVANALQASQQKLQTGGGVMSEVARAQLEKDIERQQRDLERREPVSPPERSRSGWNSCRAPNRQAGSNICGRQGAHHRIAIKLTSREEVLWTGTTREGGTRFCADFRSS